MKVSCSNYTIVKVTTSGEAVELYSGTPKEAGHDDGGATSARHHSPHEHSNMGEALFVCDTGNKSARLVSNAKPSRELSAVFSSYSSIFHMDHNRRAPRLLYNEALSLVDKLVTFFTSWGEQTRQRTGRASTQGPDQIIPYYTRRSFMLVYERLVRLENLTAELHASDLLLGIKLTSIVTLLAENFFSLMRKHDSMPIQHECGTRRALCVQELQKKMYQGQFFYTGPKSQYPGNTLCVWRPNPCRQKTSSNFMILLRLTEGVLGNTQLDTRERRKLNAYRILYLLVSSSPTNHRCSGCGKDCHSRIGLQSHSRERQKT